MKIAIVILNWNGKELLEKFLPSVIKNSEGAAIYVADNASTDSSIEFLKSNFPNVTIIQNSENGGYAKGYNDALKLVDADLFCLLNSDVEVTKGWLEPVINEFKEQESTTIIQPKILDYKNKSYFEYAGAAGGFIDKYGYPFCRGRIFNTLEKDEEQYNNSTEIFWASGACFFIKKETFNQLNGFDESFFAHMEEIDLCWRAHNSGHTVKYIGASVVYHVGGATLNNTNPEKTYLNFRNSLFTLVKNAHGNIFLLVFIRLLLDGLAGIKFLIEFKPNHTISIIKAHFSFYGNLPNLMKKRRQQIKLPKYSETPSIVWDYYIKNKKHFNCL
jgi:GT2 family glycosyltransferase